MNTRFLLISLCFLISLSCFASFPEFFGSSAKTQALGNQFTNDADDPENNFYVPAQAAFAKRFSFSLTGSHVSTKFEEIKDVVLANSVTRNSVESGNVDTDYQDTYMASAHLILPILKKDGFKLALSGYFPLIKVLEANSGDPFQPEYVMYKARYNRTMLYGHVAYPFNETLSFSVGTLASFQTSSTFDSVQKLNGTTGGASGSMKTKVTPSVASVISVMKKFKPANVYFTYHQEMKTNLEASVTGVTASPTVPMDQTITSMFSYDPHIFRLGTATNFDLLNVFASVEFQSWDNYKTPTLRIKQNGGSLEGSEDYENLTIKDIWVPKLGVNYKFTDRFEASLGAFYRPTPLQKDQSTSGNSLDADTTALTGGATFKVPWKGSWMSLSLGLQYHMLKEETVEKSAGREDGSGSENKVGYPGYKIGGEILAASLGLNFSY